jgi:hypothetical protein
MCFAQTRLPRVKLLIERAISKEHKLSFVAYYGKKREQNDKCKPSHWKEALRKGRG